MHHIVRTVLFVTVLTLATPASVFGQEASEADLPDAPQISAETFSSARTWYRPVDATFSWTLPEEMTAVAVDVGPDRTFEPMTPIRPPQSSYTFTADAFTHGMQYVGVQFRNEAGWGATSYYPVRIDVVPPEAMTVETVTDADTGIPSLTFRAEDELSGIAGYILSINDGQPTLVSPEDAAEGYSFAGLPPGSYTVAITALDQAGNAMTERLPIYVFDAAALASHSGTTTNELLIFLLGVLVAATTAIAIQVYQRSRREEARLREEFMEVHEQLEKIFAALRDEIEAQVATINEKRKPTKAEARVVENLQNVLSVSKTLVAKEMKDVRKLLKRRR